MLPVRATARTMTNVCTEEIARLRDAKLDRSWRFSVSLVDSSIHSTEGMGGMVGETGFWDANSLASSLSSPSSVYPAYLFVRNLDFAI